MLNLLGAGAVRRQDRCAWLEGDIKRRRTEEKMDLLIEEKRIQTIANISCCRCFI